MPVTATPTGGPGYAQRVNAGGEEYRDSLGNTWAADQAFATGSWGYVGTSTGTYTVTNAIAGTTDDQLYQTERNNMTQYRFTVPNGTYQVTLKFSENFFSAAGKRVFDVQLEGTTVLRSFDIFKEAGNLRFKAVDRTFTTTVSDGVLNIAFTAIVEKPKISAVAVIQQ